MKFTKALISLGIGALGLCSIPVISTGCAQKLSYAPEKYLDIDNFTVYGFKEEFWRHDKYGKIITDKNGKPIPVSSYNAVKIPEGVKILGTKAFSDLPWLNAVSLPDSLISIGANAFGFDRKLSSINLPYKLNQINTAAFEDCHSLSSVVLPDSLDYIADYAFEYCTSLKSISIPESVKFNFGKYVFAHDTKLSSVTLHDSFENINNGTFCYCENLKSINIPDSVTRIGNSAFEGCKKLSSIQIPNSIQEIGDSAFRTCGLQSMSFKSIDGVSSPKYGLANNLGNKGFVLMLNDPSTGLTFRESTKVVACAAFGELTFPESVTYIGSSDFYGCNNLKGVTFSEKCFEVDSHAFQGCTSLTSVTFPEGKSASKLFWLVGDQAFWACYGLKDVNLPSGISKLGSNAFWDAGPLENIYLNWEFNQYPKLNFSSNIGTGGLPPLKLGGTVHVKKGCSTFFQYGTCKPLQLKYAGAHIVEDL